MAKTVTMEFADFSAQLSLDNPIADYVKLMDGVMKADVIMPQEVYNECWRKISAAARESIWNMLFGEKKSLGKASELLKLHKEDACFYQATEYNKWIFLVRDELLKRKMIDFWKNEVVAKELGPCWVRDSDLFDDPEDPEPANFYRCVGCEAPWLKKKTEAATPKSTEEMIAASLFHKKPPKSEKTLKKLSTDTPLQDYKHNMEAQGEISGDDEGAYKQIFAEVRDMIWKLLFSESKLTEENSKKAAELLEEYKRDACFYSPFDYNDWIPTVKNELLNRKYFDFWQDVVVKKELGLCWARDSDYFDDMEDPKPLEFYKVEKNVIEQKK